MSQRGVSLRIGIDLMGSDTPPSELFQAVIQAGQQLPGPLTFVVFATPEEIDTLKLAAEPISPAISFHAAEEVITMEDQPLSAVRNKKLSSLLVGIDLLAEHRLDAFISAGNTGAFVAAAALKLPMLPGIKRPALLATLPTKTGSVAVIDVGGNVHCRPSHLLQFAHLGAAYQSCRQGIKQPRVGLLNVGVESKKGTWELQQAYKALSTLAPINHCFVGNVEGREVFDGKVDVLVTDGFTGNILLKTSEGAASFALRQIEDALVQSGSTVPHTVIDVISQLRGHLDYTEYPGAIVCGVEGIVIKCHGNASSRGMLRAIREACNLIQRNLIDRLKTQLIQSL